MIKISKPNIHPEDVERLLSVIESGYLVHGARCEELQSALTSYLDIPHAMLVSSGTAALHLALLSLEIGRGDAVLVPNFTFPATVNVVRLVGAEPVLVDVDPHSYTVTRQTVERAVRDYRGSSHIRAVMPVHEFGYPVDVSDLCHDVEGIEVIEDAACALGASVGGHKTGTLGRIGCFSFHPRKVLTTGEGGLITTADPEVAERIRRLKNHGIERRDGQVSFSEPGYNYRMTDLQAALGIGQLERLDGWIATRRALARRYGELLEAYVDRGWLTLPSGHEGHSWQTYMIVLSDRYDRDLVISALRSRGVETNVGAQSLTSIDHLRGYESTTELKHSERLGRQGLALPLCEAYTDETLNFVVEALSEVLEEES